MFWYFHCDVWSLGFFGVWWCTRFVAIEMEFLMIGIKDDLHFCRLQNRGFHSSPTQKQSLQLDLVLKQQKYLWNDDSFPVFEFSMTHFQFRKFRWLISDFWILSTSRTVFSFFETAKTVFQVFKRIKVVFVGCRWVISGFGILDDSFPICLRRQDQVLVFFETPKTVFRLFETGWVGFFSISCSRLVVYGFWWVISVFKNFMTHFWFRNFWNVKNCFQFFWNGKNSFSCFLRLSMSCFRFWNDSFPFLDFLMTHFRFWHFWWVISVFRIFDGSFLISQFLKRQERFPVLLKRQELFFCFQVRDWSFLVFDESFPVLNE